LLHRISGAALACALLAFGLWASWRTRRRAGTWLCACATLLLLVGSLNAGLGGAAAPLLVVVHNALAAAALALLARLG
jgi:heme A synthase